MSTRKLGFSGRLGVAIVRFKVGEKEEDSTIELYNKLYSHFELIPPGASKPLIKPRSIADVPILGLTFWSNRYDSYTLRRVAEEPEVVNSIVTTAMAP